METKTLINIDAKHDKKLGFYIKIFLGKIYYLFFTYYILLSKDLKKAAIIMRTFPVSMRAFHFTVFVLFFPFADFSRVNAYFSFFAVFAPFFSFADFSRVNAHFFIFYCLYCFSHLRTFLVSIRVFLFWNIFYLCSSPST